MTISVLTASNTFTGNGAQTAFAYTFGALANDEIAVTVAGAVINPSLYSVARDTTDNQGGTVTFLTAPANGAAIKISSSPSFEQGVDADNAGAFNAASLEEAFDRCAIRDIYLNGQLTGGTFTGPAGPTGPSGTMTVGTVTTGAAGSSVLFVNVGTASAAIWNVTIPRGDTGATGASGAAAVNPNYTYATGAPGSNVAPSGTYPNITLTIPRGDPGASGALGDGTYVGIVVSGTGSALNVVAGHITLARMANLAANSFLGNNTGAAATPIAMTIAQSKALLAITQADVTSLVSDLALKAPLASPTFTGVPAGPTAAAATSTTQLATTAFVTTADNLKANLASPTLTGTPAAPTAAAGTKTTQIATTAFVNTPAIQAVASAATVTPTFADDQVNVTAQAVALALANPSGTAQDGWGWAIRIKDNGTARAITYDTQYRAVGITLPTATLASKVLYLGGVWNAQDSKVDILSARQE